jgi:segregation and condensation protein B
MREDTEIPGASEPIDLGGMSSEGMAMDRQRDEDLRLVEAILFAASEPVSEGAIIKRVGEEADVVGLLNELAERYAGRGVNVVKVGDKWALRTAPDLAPRLKFEIQVARKLSRAAVETLAIIAYHQPVTRAEVEEIRGVALSKGTLEGLMEQGWIKPGRRREVPGRPGTWMTTELFLNHFGLERLEDLPGMSELRAAGLLDARPVNMPLSARERAEGEEEPDSSDEESELDTASGSDTDEGDTSTDRVDHLVEGAIERK